MSEKKNEKNILRSEIQRVLASVEQQLATMQMVLGERFVQLEISVLHQDSGIEMPAPAYRPLSLPLLQTEFCNLGWLHESRGV